MVKIKYLSPQSCSKVKHHHFLTSQKYKSRETNFTTSTINICKDIYCYGKLEQLWTSLCSCLVNGDDNYISFFHNLLHLIVVIVLPICVKCTAWFVWKNRGGLKTGFSLLARIAFDSSLVRNHEKMWFVSIWKMWFVSPWKIMKKYDFVKW